MSGAVCVSALLLCQTTLPRSQTAARVFLNKSLHTLNTNYSLKMPLTGHCLCGAVTYSVDVDAPLITGYDHCDDCQRQSGSTYCECVSFLPHVLPQAHISLAKTSSCP